MASSWLGRARRGGSTRPARAALAAVLADPIFELLPLKSIGDQIRHLPAGARVSVTASPNKGIDATLDWAIRLQADGFRAIPHLSARMIASRDVSPACSTGPATAGSTRAFVVGGDADEPGEYLDGLSLLRAMTELGHPFATIGCPAYPQGHPDIPDAALARGPRRQGAVRRPRDDPDGLRHDGDRDAGSGPAAPRASRRPSSSACRASPTRRSSSSIAARIGVKDAKRFLVKNLRFVTGLARSPAASTSRPASWRTSRR